MMSGDAGLRVAAHHVKSDDNGDHPPWAKAG
jgi:hypothetical protein